MTNKVITEVVVPLLEREFDVNETMKVLTYNQRTFWSWGVSKRMNVLNKGLLLRVNGRHHKGDVLITLGWDDTYTVRIMKTSGKIVDTYTMVYFDLLTEIIDNRIERIPEYVR